LAFVHTGAHEVGHALLNGTGGTANSLGLGYGHLSATKRYLQNHPEEALTGNWETDVAAHEERFAEGYAVMVTTKVLSLLGYTAERSKSVLEELSFSSEVADRQPGMHQADFLDHVDADKPLHGFVVDKKTELGEAVAGQTYNGSLGYELPLTKEQITDQLRDLYKSMISRDNFTDEPDDPKMWHELVKSVQNPEVKKQLDALKSARAETIKKHEKTAAKQKRQEFIGRILLRRNRPRKTTKRTVTRQ
jgi:hypothetical protein